MKKIFNISTFILGTLILEQSNAEVYYSWEKSSSKPDSGKCFELDKRTNGKAYRSKVKDKFCRPGKTYFAFHAKSAKCYEVDEETNGEDYFSKVAIDQCKPEKTYINFAKFNNRSACYEIDTETKGQAYFKRLSQSRCKEVKIAFHWKAISENEGECYTGAPDKLIPTKKELCRTDKTIFKFVRSNKLTGICYQQDEKSGNYFSLRVKTEECLKNNKMKTYFASYMDPKVQLSECYQIDTETNGEKYINKVSVELCKE